ncbi:MAG: NAD(P)-dependent oxidoreductase [Phycisphaerae bacterium]
MAGNRQFRIVVAESFNPDTIARLRECADVTLLDTAAPDTIIAALPDADALLVRPRAHVTARVINAAPKLKVIGRAGPSVDHIDLRAARRRDISVVYTPEVAVSSTAEFALALILALHRRLLYFNRFIRQGQFENLRAPAGHELAHQTVGLLGLGPVAERLGAICKQAFGCRVIYHDPAGGAPVDFRAESMELEDFLRSVDILSIHLRLTPQTRGLVSAARLALLKPTAMLVNTSRGAVIDTTALAKALRANQVAAAALDVFEVEPLPSDHPLRKAPNCILTPHVAGATLDAATARDAVAEDIIRVLQGHPPHFPAQMPSV